MVKVTFDYGNKEDHTLIREMISGEQSTAVPSEKAYETLQREWSEERAPKQTLLDKTLEEKVAAEKATRAPVVETPKPPAPDTPAPVEYVDAEGGEVVVEAKTITAAEALPKVAAYCQANGLDKPQAYFARIGKANIHDLTPEQIVELLTELGIEV